jgi:hypothetical protein
MLAGCSVSSPFPTPVPHPTVAERVSTLVADLRAVETQCAGQNHQGCDSASGAAGRDASALNVALVMSGRSWDWVTDDLLHVAVSDVSGGALMSVPETMRVRVLLERAQTSLRSVSDSQPAPQPSGYASTLLGLLPAIDTEIGTVSTACGAAADARCRSDNQVLQVGCRRVFTDVTLMRPSANETTLDAQARNGISGCRDVADGLDAVLAGKGRGVTVQQEVDRLHGIQASLASTARALAT